MWEAKGTENIDESLSELDEGNYRFQAFHSKIKSHADEQNSRRDKRNVYNSPKYKPIKKNLKIPQTPKIKFFFSNSLSAKISVGWHDSLVIFGG